MKQNRVVIWTMVTALAISLTLLAQIRPAFDVVSTKANNSANGFLRIGGQPAAGRFIATNATVEMLITWAYRIQNYQLSGGAGLDQNRDF